MTKKTVLTSLLTVGMLLGVSSHALAVPLSTLTGGGSVTIADVTFDTFSYTDVGAGFGDLAVPANTIDVTASSTATTVTLLFDFDPDLQVAFDDVFEINGGFSTSVTGSSRELISVDLQLQAAVTGNIGDFVFIELGSNTLADSATIDPANAGPQSFGSALANLSTYPLLWDMQGEAGDPGTSASVNAFQVTFELHDPVQTTVPESATLPLILSGLIGMGVLGMRRNSA